MHCWSIYTCSNRCSTVVTENVPRPLVWRHLTCLHKMALAGWNESSWELALHEAFTLVDTNVGKRSTDAGARLFEHMCVIIRATVQDPHFHSICKEAS